jgi:Tol biopolymer transport system component
LAEISRNGWQWLLLSWSPDSRWLAFASDSLPDKPANAAPRYRIHLLNVESGEERVLPDPAPDCTMLIEPSISPDGKYLASVCVLALGINKLYVQRIDGELPREIAQIDTSFVLAGIAWSADGRSIIYSTYGTTGRLWRISAEGGRPQQISVAHGTEVPAVARVGNKLAYAQTNYPYDVWSIGLRAGMSAQKPFKLISSTWDQANARISPDGKLIAFDSSRSGNYEIWVCDRDGSKPVQLSFFDGPVTGDPRWSPDGRQIVFNSKVSGQPQSYIAAVDGGHPKRLETGTSKALSPSWSSDGRWIYFATEQPNGVWKVPPGGGVAVRLTSEGAYPQESADGKRVFYVVGGERGRLWSASVSGGDARPEDGVPVLLNPLSWAPDQTGIYFVDGGPWQYSIKYFSFSSRRTTKISDLNGMSFVCCGLTVDHHNNTVLFSAVDRLESDIMLVENFH